MIDWKEAIIKPILPIWVMAIICVLLLICKRKGIASFIRQIVIVLLIFAINLRIMVPDNNIIVQKEKLDSYVIFVIDDTISMLANDYGHGYTRLDAVKADCKRIVEDLNGSRFAVIGFNNEAQIMQPFSDDIESTERTIDALYPIPSINATGSNVSVARNLIVDLINNVKLLDESHIVVFFISDGENTGSSRLKSFEEAGQYVEAGAVLGYGTTEGGQMNYFDSETHQTTLIMDETGSRDVPAVSCIDEDNLNTIATELNVPYIHMTSHTSADATVKNIKKLLNSNTEEITKRGYRDTYYYLVLPLAVLLGYEFISIKRKV